MQRAHEPVGAVVPEEVLPQHVKRLVVVSWLVRAVVHIGTREMLSASH